MNVKEKKIFLNLIKEMIDLLGYEVDVENV